MEKIPFALGYPFVVRIVIPGVVGVFSILPVISNLTGVDFFQFKIIKEHSYILVPASLLYGFIVFIMDSLIYFIYEGRFCCLYFPKLFKLLVNIQKRRVKKLQREVISEKDAARNAEIMSKLKGYPYRERKYTADYPTILGNILINAERYPLERYGMETTFYWPRLWLALDKETRKEIDLQASTLDGLLYTSFVTLVSAMAYLCYFAGLIVGKIPQIPALFTIKREIFGTSPLVSIFFSLLLLSYLIYRAAIPFAELKAEYFKTIFDIYRKKISKLTEIAEVEPETWKKTWKCLQYGKKFCDKSRSFTKK